MKCVLLRKAIKSYREEERREGKSVREMAIEKNGKKEEWKREREGGGEANCLPTSIINMCCR